MAKDVHTKMFISALFIIVTIGNNFKCPSVEDSLNEEWYIYEI